MSSFLDDSYSGSESGSITFTDKEVTTNGGINYYTFYGNKVCNVLGLPEGIPIYTENFKLSDSATDTSNYILKKIDIANNYEDYTYHIPDGELYHVRQDRRLYLTEGKTGLRRIFLK